MIDELLKARIKHCKKLCLKLEEGDADYAIDLIETLQQLLINVVSKSVTCYTCNCTKGKEPEGNNYCNMCDHHFQQVMFANGLGMVSCGLITKLN